ncbi:hypothetical protein [Silvanigrella aquatica]|uniref:Uncharacterized protein n=1 Tax=Silvanigrella aquatica TaxID=1915309 RepID=A0A1L4D397_9BACT|nr:hypothetical protein [Silvanigrella aquatica]APJ04670.1 hypothetical protein AXG55_12455 [Silvanigrella aquatica]
MEKELPFAKAQSSEQMLIELLFHFSILMEYQLIDLQSNVRAFVEAMSDAIQKMDGLVVEEGRSAQEIYESLFNKATNTEATALNQRANFRADDIFAEAAAQANPKLAELIKSTAAKESENKTEGESASGSNAFDKIWSEISKRFESVCRLEERLRPQVYTMIQSLNFEDIQTQRIEHALLAQKKLNEGMMKFLKKGLSNCDLKEILEFSTNLVRDTKASYTMSDERRVFEQVFYEDKK